jgi:adenylate cyclase
VEALITQKFRRQVRKGEMAFMLAHDGQRALEVLDRGPDVDIVRC